jgi:hypothetical protein
MVWFVVAAAAIQAIEPARGQTYDPRYPVCMQTFGTLSGINCSFMSMASCRMLAQGRAAQCVTNPYFVQRRKSRH